MASTAAAPSPRYHPRAATNTLKEIVENHLEELLQVFDERFRDTCCPLHPRVKELFLAFTRCGDPHHGFLRLHCPRCGEDRVLPYSCKVRGLCPACGKKRALVWAERMVEQVLPEVPYVQVVFTIPKMLRPYFLWDRSLYGELSRVAYAATLEFLRAHFPSLKDAVPAMVISPQSHGSLLHFPTSIPSAPSASSIAREASTSPPTSTSGPSRSSSASAPSSSS